MNHTIVSLLLAAAVVPGCVMDREIALENGEQPVANDASDLLAACTRMEEALPQLACSEDHADPSRDLYALYCGQPPSPGDILHTCFVAGPTSQCLAVVAPLLDCIADQTTCDPENDCSEHWVDECGPDYTPPPPPEPPYEFFTTCERGGTGLRFLGSATPIFEGLLEDCDDGHEYSFECPVEETCSMECTCAVDGQVTGVGIPSALVETPHIVIEVQHACGWTVERPMGDDAAGNAAEDDHDEACDHDADGHEGSGI